MVTAHIVVVCSLVYETLHCFLIETYRKCDALRFFDDNKQEKVSFISIHLQNISYKYYR